jgi:hypothetical protein
VSLTGPEKTRQVHEFMVLSFAPRIDPDAQKVVMAALDAHFARRDGILSREYFRDVDGRWVKHLIWRSEEDLDASADLEEDPAVAELFACFESETVAYAICERFEPPEGDTGMAIQTD